MSDGTALLVAVLLLAGNAFFVGAEIALVSVRRAQIEPRAEAGSARARITMKALSKVSLMMAGAQLGITVCSLGLGATAEPAIAHLIEPAFEAIGLPDAWVHPVAFAVALSFVVVIHMVLGEMVPKNIALAVPDRTALTLGPALYRVVTILRPIIWTFNQGANLVLRLLGVQPLDEVAAGADLAGVRSIVAESSTEGTLDADDAQIVGRALDLPDVTVADLCLPLDDVLMLRPTDSTSDLYRAATETGYSRFPVLGAGGQPFGYVHIRDAVAEPSDGASWVVPGTVADLPVTPLAHLPHDLSLMEALGRMRDAATHMAEVVDAQERSLGVVTLEDALERLIGEVRDPAHRRPHGGAQLSEKAT